MLQINLKITFQFSRTFVLRMIELDPRFDVTYNVNKESLLEKKAILKDLFSPEDDLDTRISFQSEV